MKTNWKKEYWKMRRVFHAYVREDIETTKGHNARIENLNQDIKGISVLFGCMTGVAFISLGMNIYYILR